MTVFRGGKIAFEGPSGWDVVPSAGLREPERPSDGKGGAVRASLVLTEDQLPPGKSRQDYLAAQSQALSQLMARVSMTSEARISAGGVDATEWTLQVTLNAGVKVEQRQAYLWYDDFVAILTLTTNEGDPQSSRTWADAVSSMRRRSDPRDG